MSAFAQHILVATDFSQASYLALDAAALLAQTMGAQITLLHVFDPAPFAAASFPMQPVDLVGNSRELAERIEKGLQELRASRLAKVERVETRLVEHASPAEGICESARQVGADLIVVSTHGRTGLAHLLIGSVAERVVRFAPCPVLTLRSKAES
jgi:nucleotide-binding universal stress UspA family protein